MEYDSCLASCSIIVAECLQICNVKCRTIEHCMPLVEILDYSRCNRLTGFDVPFWECIWWNILKSKSFEYISSLGGKLYCWKVPNFWNFFVHYSEDISSSQIDNLFNTSGEDDFYWSSRVCDIINMRGKLSRSQDQIGCVVTGGDTISFVSRIPALNEDNPKSTDSLRIVRALDHDRTQGKTMHLPIGVHPMKGCFQPPFLHSRRSCARS